MYFVRDISLMRYVPSGRDKKEEKKNMKFIHTGDLHLGYKYSSSFSSDTLNKLMENQKKVLSNIIDLSIEKSVDALLIAGDLFDNKNPDSSLTDFVLSEFKRANCNIFIICGNHDPLTFDSVYSNTVFPENVYIFGEEITKVSFDDYDIYGYSFTNIHKTNNSFAGFKVLNDDKINIMLAHGDLVADSFYNPIMPSDIEKSGLSYLALGHIHIDNGIKRLGNTYYGYCGTPQGSTFKETVKAKVICGEITSSHFDYEEIEVCEHSFAEVNVDISGAENSDEITGILKAALSEYDISQTLFTINLTGYLKDGITVDTEYIISKFPALLYMDIKKNLRIKYNIELLIKEQSLRGEFIRNAFEFLKDKDEDYIEKVIEYGVSRL